MTHPIDTLEKTTPTGERCRSALRWKVTTFCHHFRRAPTLGSRSFPLRKHLSACRPPVMHSAVPLSLTVVTHPRHVENP